MRPIKILGIAPYEELNHSMNIIGDQFKEVETTIYTADLVEGQKLATKLYTDGYDAIISRGGTAKLIRKVVSLPVIDVSLSIYDVLSSIRLAENYTNNFVVVGYPSITEKAHLLCDLLGYSIEIHTIDDDIDAAEILNSLAEKKYELILCDAITNQIALSKSLNTILITSGFESIKNAYKEALTIVKHVNKVKLKQEILENGILSHQQKFLLFDEKYTIEFTNLDLSLAQAIVKSLQAKPEKKEVQQYYSQVRDTFFTIKIKKYTIDQHNYYSCLLNEHNSPTITSNQDIHYQKKSEVSNNFSSRLLFNQFIPENIKSELKKYEKHYQAYLIFGERGTAKKNIAYQIYLNQTKNNNYLITVDCKHATDKLWRFLVNSANGPFVDTHNTIFFENVEQLTLADIERLASLIEMVNVSSHNNLIFTYNLNKSDDKIKFEHLMSQLKIANIYVPSIRERKNELSIITTLILNKMNIECNKDIIGFEPKALDTVLAFDWPGNFNQLQYCLKELVINASTRYISEHQVTELLNKERLLQSFSNMNAMNFTAKNSLHQPTLFDYTKEIILNILEQNKGNQTKTASQLGISRTTLWRYLKDSE